MGLNGVSVRKIIAISVTRLILTASDGFGRIKELLASINLIF